MKTANTAETDQGNSQPNRQPENIIPLPKERKAARIIVSGQFVVKEYDNASGSLSYRVDGYKRDRTRIRENYAEEKKARARQIELETEWLSGVARTEVQATKLTREQISLAESGFIRLGPGNDAEMTMAIEAWVRTGRQNSVSKSPRLDEAFKDFCEWLDKSELRQLSRKNLQRRVNVFINSVPNLRASDVTPDTIDGYLSKRAVSPKSRDNDRRAVSRFFAWCIERPRKWVSMNPCREVKVHRGDEAPPAVLTIAQCEALLRAAEKLEKGRLAPYTAVCLFGGLRPFEASRLTWGAVNLSDGEIRLESHETKTGTSRVVSICPTLKAWLKAYNGKPFFPSNWRRDLDAIKESAGLIKRETTKSKGKIRKRKKGRVVQAYRYWKTITPINWVPDIMRHTAISHYFRKTGSYGQTAEQFGNSESIIKRHYASRVSSEDTKAFYALMPKKGGRK